VRPDSDDVLYLLLSTLQKSGRELDPMPPELLLSLHLEEHDEDWE
jgi:hypothetical protein